MKTMPFLPELKHWAAATPGAMAVSDTARSLNYAQLLAAAERTAADWPPAGRGTGNAVLVIEEASVVDLAVQWCAARLAGRVVMVLDAGWPPSVGRALRDAAGEWTPPGSGVDAGHGNDPCFLLGLSSGTGGMPKGFVRREASWRNSFVQSSHFFGVDSGSVVVAPGPPASSMNLYALGEALFAGAGFVALPRFSPEAALAALNTHAPTHLVVVPTLLQLMATYALDTGRAAPTLQRIVCAGAALGAPTLEAVRRWAPGVVVQQYYGAAELGFVAASTVEDKPEPAGEAFPRVRWSIQDGQGTQLPQGELGTICVQSPYVCAGYAWGDDGLAFQAMTPGVQTSPDRQLPWYTVHDRGWIDPEGRLRVAGRAADMILVAGANVYPHTIEAVLSAAVAMEVVVTGVPDALRGQRVAAAILPAQGDAADGLAACRQAAAELPAAHRPTRWYALDALPVTGRGKISRALLAQWIEQEDSHVRRL